MSCKEHRHRAFSIRSTFARGADVVLERVRSHNDLAVHADEMLCKCRCSPVESGFRMHNKFYGHRLHHCLKPPFGSKSRREPGYWKVLSKAKAKPAGDDQRFATLCQNDVARNRAEYAAEPLACRGGERLRSGNRSGPQSSIIQAFRSLALKL